MSNLFYEQLQAQSDGVRDREIYNKAIDDCLDCIKHTYSTYNDIIYDICNELEKLKGGRNEQKQ